MISRSEGQINMIQKDGYSYHETAEISPKATIGLGTKIWNQAQVREGARIGVNCIISKNVYIDFDVSIGNGVKIQNNVSIWHGVTIENEVFIGPQVAFTNDMYPRAFIWNPERVAHTVVKRGASISANATIICGETPRIIGEYALVGAGAVVTKNVPPNALVLGNPARIVGYVCKCAHRLKETGTIRGNVHEMVCTDSNCSYNETNEIHRIEVE